MSSSHNMPQSVEELVSQFPQVIENQQYDKIAALLEHYPDSFELHFLEGSYHAEHGEYEQAKNAFMRCLHINPEFHISRFQLCFLALLNQDIEVFNNYIEPLLLLGDNNYLAMFAKALIDILHDETAHAKAHLRDGLMLNNENISLNDNMNRLLALISEEQDVSLQNNDSEEEDLNTSTNSVLLDIYKNKFN